MCAVSCTPITQIGIQLCSPYNPPISQTYLLADISHDLMDPVGPTLVLSKVRNQGLVHDRQLRDRLSQLAAEYLSGMCRMVTIYQGHDSDQAATMILREVGGPIAWILIANEAVMTLDIWW